MEPEVHRRQAKVWLLFFVIVLIIAGIGVWYFSRSGSLAKIISWENSTGTVALRKVVSDISNPAPLIATGTKSAANGSGYSLTIAGVILETNVQRKENGGLVGLRENGLLDKIALERLNDMAAKQYFAHISPSGSSATVLAKADGYESLALGENLALGNFIGNVGVIDAWMHSPGHRANILNTHYTEIGVAVKEVIFDGNDTWLAVQVFGRPASDCSAPDANALLSLNSTAVALTQMQSDLSAKKISIEAMSPSDPSYNQTIDQYNSDAGKYNALAEQAKASVAAYNVKVEAYNSCLGK